MSLRATGPLVLNYSKREFSWRENTTSSKSPLHASEEIAHQVLRQRVTRLSDTPSNQRKCRGNASTRYMAGMPTRRRNNQSARGLTSSGLSKKHARNRRTLKSCLALRSRGERTARRRSIRGAGPGKFQHRRSQRAGHCWEKREMNLMSGGTCTGLAMKTSGARRKCWRCKCQSDPASYPLASHAM